VVAFHLDAAFLPGGFLGVDLFFVISGFLITRLLLLELVGSGSIDLKRFYKDRFRRLAPSVAIVVAAVLIGSELFWRDELATVKTGVLSSLGYVTNWWLIFDHQSYFVSTGRPPMLQHLWSLAIEEQYYLLWPCLILLVTVVGRAARTPERRMASVIWLALLLAVASAVAMAVIAVRTNVPYVSDSSRVYYGTDTHSVGLFLGSAAGAWNVLMSGRVRSRRAFLWASDLLAAGGLTLLAWEFAHLNEYRPSLYRGGFLFLDAIAVLVICAVARRGSAVGWLLDRPLLRWIGQRSYAIYLWHWPIIVVTRPGVDIHASLLTVTLLRVALTLALAELSYRFVENPLRGRRWALEPKRIAHGMRLRAPVFGAMLVVAVVYVAASPQATNAAPLTGQRASGLDRPGASTGAAAAATAGLIAKHAAPSSSSPPSAAAPSSDTSVATTSAPVASSTTAAAPAPSPAAPSPAAPSPAAPVSISAFGDSVLLGAQPALAALDPATTVDAVEGRQAYLVLDDIVARRQADQLGSVVVIHTGNNGVINPDQLSSTLQSLAGRKVVVLTDKVPRDWQGPNNATIESVCARFANVKVIDWLGISSAHPEWFYSDGLHLRPAGASAYAQLIVTAAGG